MLSLVYRTAALAALGAVAGLILNALRPDGISLQQPSAAAVCKVADVAHPVERLSPAQANQLCADKRVLLADARSAEDFASGHVAGAIHLPCAAPGDVASAVPRLLQGRQTVVVYGETTADALTVADGLRRRHNAEGMRIAVIEGGFAAWDQAGLACASGPCPECAEGRHEHETNPSRPPPPPPDQPRAQPAQQERKPAP